MSEHDRMTDPQFAAVEEAMRRSKLGAAFLDAFAGRSATVNAEKVFDALSEIKGYLDVKPSAGHIEILRRELQEMSASIVETRREIAAIKPEEDGGSNRIVAATGELDAIVTATERATGEILGAAENVQDIVEKLRALDSDTAMCDEIDEQMTDIFMACSFQDITGQHITKVVNAIRYIEQRVNSMIDIWGIDGVEPVETGDAADDHPDAHLLQGPQLEGEGADQSEIDRILEDALAS